MIWESLDKTAAAFGAKNEARRRKGGQVKRYEAGYTSDKSVRSQWDKKKIDVQCVIKQKKKKKKIWKNAYLYFKCFSILFRFFFFFYLGYFTLTRPLLSFYISLSCGQKFQEGLDPDKFCSFKTFVKGGETSVDICRGWSLNRKNSQNIFIPHLNISKKKKKNYNKYYNNEKKKKNFGNLNIFYVYIFIYFIHYLCNYLMFNLRVK